MVFCAALSGAALAFFRWRARTPRIAPVLQERAAADPGWLPHPVSAFQAPDMLQQSSAATLAEVLAGLLACGVVVAAVAFLTLVLMHFSQRRAEFATRAALGETPGMSTRGIARPIMSVTATGVFIGAALASLLLILAVAAWPGELNRSLWMSIEAGAASALVCALICAGVAVLIVRLFVVRSAVAALLRGGSRAVGSLLETRTRELLVVLQTAACVLVVSLAGVLMQSRPRPINASPSWRALEVIRARAHAEGLSTAQRLALLDSVLGRAHQLPGVSAESLASAGSIVGVAVSDRLFSECDVCRFGPAFVPYTLVTLRMHAVAPRYFELSGTRLLAGREFSANDRLGAPPVVIVNSAFAHKVFGQNNPLGRTVRLQNGMSKPHRIVGLVENSSLTALGAPPARAPQVYFSALQYPPVTFDLILRTSAALRFTQDDVVAEEPVSLSRLRSLAALPVRVAATAALLLGLLCGLIAMYGLYSTTQSMVEARVHELGVRGAVGATPFALVRYAAGRTLRLALIGIVLGFVGAYAAQQLLVGILPGAVLTMRGVASAGLLVLVATMVGVARPALRAARVEPALAL